MRIVVVGAQGMLGSDLVARAANKNVLALSSADLDVRDIGAIGSVVEARDVVINCAAYTRVDDAESDEDAAFEVNAIGPANLAVVCEQRGARLITVSTDYVFRGDARTPYLESELRDPRTAYGRTKAAGEERALAAHPTGTTVLRTAWLYGANGPSFPRTMLRLAETNNSVSVVDDQFGQPTWSRDVADRVLELTEREIPSGIYHATNSGEASWYELARAVFQEAGLDEQRVTPTSSSNFVRPAPRPAYSVLGHGRWTAVGLSPMRHWREALRAAFESGVFDPDPRA